MSDVAPRPEDEQPELFNLPPAWEQHWSGMPEFDEGKNLEPFDAIKVQFRNADDRRSFLELMGESPARRRSIWFPRMAQSNPSGKPPVHGTVVPAGRYPIYVISKGRWETPLTARALDKLGISYSLVVEPQEVESYASALPSARILELPFANLGQGSIPARNWCWGHAVEAGFARHWILDDNIEGFYRRTGNEKAKVRDVNPFTPIEVFADRYTNVALAGMQYESFCPRRAKVPPYRLNTRIYSCILIQNTLPHRWRGRYNEDTDLSLRVLRDGFCTVLFNAFLCNKVATMRMRGGNTDELYQGDGRRKMAESLREQHPDLVKVTVKWGRPQHHVDYSPFRRNKLIPRSPAATIGDRPKQDDAA